MPESWLKAYTDYEWTVDLTKYINRSKYPGYFNQTITPGNLIDFENKFRESLEDNEYQTAGEVCFWKNYGTFQSRNHLTTEILKQLSQPSKWSGFTKCLVDLCTSPTYQNFDVLRKSVGQLKGFATPITFLSFYDPHSYPMVDKNIAYWWAKNKDKYGYKDTNVFSQRSDGWIQTYTLSQNKQNWEAYLDWARFCRDYAKRIMKHYRMNCRARDVEMAVWMAQKKGVTLNKLEE